MHFFVAWLLSIAEITETHIRHDRNLCPMNWPIYYTDRANKIKLLQCAARANMIQLSFDAYFLENPQEYLHKPYIPRNKTPG